MPLKEITFETIDALHGHLMRIWADTHTHWRKVDEYYHRTYNLWDDETSQQRAPRGEYHPSKSTSIIDHSSDNQLAHEPKVKRFPTGSEEKAKRDADKVEPWLQAVFTEAALEEPVLTWKQIGKHLLLYGYAIVEAPVLSTEDKPTKPIQKRDEDDEDFEIRMRLYENEKKTWMPFRMRAPHPSWVLMNPLEKRPKEAIKIVNRYAYEIEDLTASRLKKNGKPRRKGAFVEQFKAMNEPYRIVTCWEYWSKELHALVADSRLLFSEVNTWQFLPFKQAFAGFGQLRTVDREINVRYMAVGMLDPIMESLLVNAQMLSGLHNSAIENSFPDKLYHGDAEGYRNQKAQGADIIQMPGQDTVEYETPPKMDRWQLESERLQEADIESGSVSSLLSGQRQKGTYTVGQEAIRVNSAEKKFLSPGLQMEHLATLVGQDVLKLVDILDESITVLGYTLKPSDIAHDYSCLIRFEIIDPILELQRRQVLSGEFGQGLLSKESFWEETKRSNISQERMRLLEDAMRADPTVMQAFIGEMARMFGITPLLEQIEKQNTAQAPSSGGLSQIFGPDGKPLASTLGADAVQGVAGAPIQSQTGQNLAGGTGGG